MSKRWSNAVHEEALRRRRLKKLERTQKKIEYISTDTSMYGNSTNEVSTKTEPNDNNYKEN